MIGLLAPLGLLGLLAVAVPIIAHLVSRRAGRVVKVGSIRWMQESPAFQARSLKLHDFWLLVLRVVVVALLALALAGPYWRHRPALVSGSEWLLVGPEVAFDATPSPVLDSLARSVGEVHLLVPGLPRWTPGDQAPLGASSVLPVLPVLPALSASPASTDYWSLLKEAEQVAPPATRFVLLTSDRARYFRGQRPRLRAQVQWRLVSVAASERAANQDTRTVELYALPARRDDARYLVAALEAAAGQAGMRLRLLRRSPSSLGPPGEAATGSTWIVWLGGEPVPDPLQQRVAAGATLLVDPPDDSVETRESLLLTGPGLAPAAHLYRRSIATVGPSPAALWTDEYGGPVLSVSRAGAGLVYRLHIRFHPDWTDLVLNPAFPRVIGSLWLGSNRESDDVAVGASQVLPGSVTRDAATLESIPTRPDLAFPLWLLALLAFGLERGVSLDWFRSRA
jgi:hypothetical protein